MKTGFILEFVRGPGIYSSFVCQHSQKKYKDYLKCNKCEWISKGYCEHCRDFKRLCAEGAKHLKKHDSTIDFSEAKLKYNAWFETIKITQDVLEDQMIEARATINIAREALYVMQLKKIGIRMRCCEPVLLLQQRRRRILRGARR